MIEIKSLRTQVSAGFFMHASVTAGGILEAPICMRLHSDNRMALGEEIANPQQKDLANHCRNPHCAGSRYIEKTVDIIFLYREDVMNYEWTSKQQAIRELRTNFGWPKCGAQYISTNNGQLSTNWPLAMMQKMSLYIERGDGVHISATKYVPFLDGIGDVTTDQPDALVLL